MSLTEGDDTVRADLTLADAGEQAGEAHAQADAEAIAE